jgi:glucose 1-dehydrogenase
VSLVLVTGVAGWIGRAAARRFAGHGWTVIGVDIKPSEEIGGVEHDTSDMSNDAEVRTLMRRIAETHGRLDAIVNVAAIQIQKPMIETSVDEWDITMAVNVKAAFLSIKHGASMLAKNGGAVVNVSSVHAIATTANMAAYATSKGALVSLTKALAVELAPSNIRVNAVLPGIVGSRSISGRSGSPEDIAAAIYFLADNKQSSFVTGEAMVVDGGASTRLMD